jgi:hypothetical protein
MTPVTVVPDALFSAQSASLALGTVSIQLTGIAVDLVV